MGDTNHTITSQEGKHFPNQHRTAASHSPMGAREPREREPGRELYWCVVEEAARDILIRARITITKC